LTCIGNRAATRPPTESSNNSTISITSRTHLVDRSTALASFERILAAFTTAGFDLESAVLAMTCVVEFTIGHVLAEAGEPVDGETPYAADALADHEADLPNAAAAWAISTPTPCT
jgi:hypothetical protein